MANSRGLQELVGQSLHYMHCTEKCRASEPYSQHSRGIVVSEGGYYVDMKKQYNK